MKLAPVVSSIAEVRAAIASARQSGKKIGLVPTMGALHAGHAGLIRASRSECEFTIATIFVNPTQFGPNEDLSRYPRTLEADRELCSAVGTDLIFAPDPEIIYPDGYRTYVEVTGLQDVLCGKSRPGHFRGVATVVLKLFQIAPADNAYFGQKDAQQLRIIQKMVRDLNVPIAIRPQPTVRESDGLAMSSRNRFLNPTERMQANCLYRALLKIEELHRAGEKSVVMLQNSMKDLISGCSGARIDYASILDSETLLEIETIDKPALAALAVYFGTTRLIDNLILVT